MIKFQKPKAPDIYLFMVSLLGLAAVAWGLILFPTYTPKTTFILLALLAAAAQFATTSVPVSQKAGITFEVGTAVALAAIPFFGPAAAATIVALSSLSIWLVKSHHAVTWKKSWRQLNFNTGMWSIAIFVAGEIFILLDNFLGHYFLGQMFIWVMVAFLNTQLNFWLLVMMLRLQHGRQVKPGVLWKENRWATTIDVLVKSCGGAFLAFATAQYDWVGIIVFFLPVLLSAYAFRLYVRQMQGQMDNMEEMITERTQELSDLMREKDGFLAVLSHDMKTPLTTIGMYAEMMIQYPDLLQKKPHIAEVLRNSQKALTEMVNNILDLEKLQVGGTLKTESEMFDLITTLEYLTDFVSVQAEKKSIEVVHNFATSSLPILGDQQQIQRVFQNLLSNALKYSPDGSLVSLEVALVEDSVHILVKDNGYGIPEADLPFIFERFRRVEKHERIANGTGMGLAIVKAIVEAHGGYITATSEEGVGSAFLVSLPLELVGIPA
jgi:signal transduction histidine kinase